jgi:exopolysaccharide production protein ExoQ
MLFLSFLLSCFLAIAYYIAYPSEAMGWTNELRGFYHHKNEMGNYSALLMLSALSLFLGGRNRLLTSFAFILGALILVSTHSGTAIVSIAAALSFVPLIILYRKSPAASSLAMGLQLLILAPILAYVLLSGVDFFDYALGSIGKDPTLTGRTILWQFAGDAISKSPFIGYGFQGWWDDSNPVVFFVRYVIGQDLWYLHNVYLEVTVSFGVLGALLLLLTFIAAYRRVLIGFWKHPDSATIWGTLYLIFVTIYSTAENALFVNHSVDYLILVVIFASNVPTGRSRAKATRSPSNRSDYGRVPLLST